MAPTEATALERFTGRLGYHFRNPELLTRALTHRSAARVHNERLEFLGDGLLNFVVGHLLYEHHAAAAEGDLSYVRASLVSEKSLAEAAERLGIADVLTLGPGELRSGSAGRPSIAADALEAVVGAVFLDGGLDAARDVCHKLFGDAIAEPPEAARVKDPKTRLQEYLQGRGRPLPVYEVHTEGPPHRQAFTVKCRAGDAATEGHGNTRKNAEQDAAEKMLEQLHA